MLVAYSKATENTKDRQILYVCPLRSHKQLSKTIVTNRKSVLIKISKSDVVLCQKPQKGGLLKFIHLCSVNSLKH